MVKYTFEDFARFLPHLIQQLGSSGQSNREIRICLEQLYEKAENLRLEVENLAERRSRDERVRALQMFVLAEDGNLVAKRMSDREIKRYFPKD